ncbi:pilus assembly protein [Enterobacter sichuanensis]|uniref:pilus assembly protein n=1 Tax=Enterobacter sichuanensis TaxID=2071710 RepID=UPI002075289A|nr:pilus assembly protein [Enterobacter sichuanensis]MCM7885059.1 pilus assembly protein [Enterobacter sichuanensis]
MDKLLHDNNILTGLLWEPESMSHLEPGAQAAFRGMVKANRRLVYKDANGQLATGYCEKISTLYEPFAIYIKDLFGDGIYFFHGDDNFTYLLIINNGRIVSGTDCFIERSLFDELMRHPEQYEHLEITLLTEVQLSVVIEKCRAQQLSMKRRRRMIICSILVGGIIFLVLLALALHFLVTG